MLVELPKYAWPNLTHYDQDQIQNLLARLTKLCQMNILFSAIACRYLCQAGWNWSAKLGPSKPLWISASQAFLSFAKSIGLCSASDALSFVLRLHWRIRLWVYRHFLLVRWYYSSSWWAKNHLLCFFNQLNQQIANANGVIHRGGSSYSWIITWKYPTGIPSWVPAGQF